MLFSLVIRFLVKDRLKVFFIVLLCGFIFIRIFIKYPLALTCINASCFLFLLGVNWFLLLILNTWDWFILLICLKWLVRLLLHQSTFSYLCLLTEIEYLAFIIINDVFFFDGLKSLSKRIKWWFQWLSLVQTWWA